MHLRVPESAVETNASFRDIGTLTGFILVAFALPYPYVGCSFFQCYNCSLSTLCAPPHNCTCCSAGP